MKHFVSLAVCILIALNGTAMADSSKDERNLDREVKRLNDTAVKPDGENAVVKRISVEFKTTESQVQALRDRKLTYGEAAIVLSLAQTQPGGTTDTNIQNVLVLREGPPVAGWDQVARQLGTKLGKTVSRIKKMNNDAHREIKKEHAHTGKSGVVAPKEPQKEQPVKREPPHQERYKGDGKLLPQGSGAK